jgi:hypothetical protein
MGQGTEFLKSIGIPVDEDDTPDIGPREEGFGTTLPGAVHKKGYDARPDPEVDILPRFLGQTQMGD